MRITNANENNINMLVETINNEFIVERKKKIHIRNRFPGLFEGSNFQNIHILNETKDDFSSVIVIKTVVINISNNLIINAFFVGDQMTPKQHQGKGYGKELFKFVTEKYLNDGYSIGVGWTRLQSLYPKLGWETFENGLIVELSGLLNVESTKKIHQCNNSEMYNILDNFRMKKSSNYIIRKNNNGLINGFGTIYSPAERSFCFYCKSGTEIIGYIYGASNSDAVFIYEAIFEQSIVFANIISYIYTNNPNKKIYINLYQNDNLIELLYNSFQKVVITQPILSIYAYRDQYIFTNLKNLYIPFTDRI